MSNYRENIKDRYLRIGGKMKTSAIVLFIIMSLFNSIANADEASHRSAAEELLLLTNTDKMLKPMWEQMESMMEDQFYRMGASDNLKPILKKYQTKMLKILEEKLGWEKVKNDFITIYVKTYSEDEIVAISNFYKSPAGRKFIEKMPQLMQETMAISQKNMPAIMEKMQEISNEMETEIIQLKEQEKQEKG